MLFREQGITIVRVFTAIGYDNWAWGSGLIPSGRGIRPIPTLKPDSGCVKDWIKKKKKKKYKLLVSY